MRNITLAILIWMISFFPLCAWAIPYGPAQPVEILTESVEKQGFSPIKWLVVPEALENGSTGVGFYQNASGQSIGRLIISNLLSDISWEGMDISSKQFQSDDLLIFSGVPIPCDVLPVAKLFEVDEPLIYEVRIHAGGRNFVERIRVTSTLVSFEEARTKGWMKYTGDENSILRMMKAVNLRTHELMVEQLWEDGNSWWIYEETPYRRSWRLR